MTRLQHKNLVKLLGFCNEGDEEILVYEFVPHSSLDRFIFGKIWKDQIYMKHSNRDLSFTRAKIFKKLYILIYNLYNL